MYFKNKDMGKNLFVKNGGAGEGEAIMEKEA
jgi:hypothetical protein